MMKNKLLAINGQGIYNSAIGNLNNNTGVGFIQKLIALLISLAFIVGAIVFFFMLITGGIKWMLSGGDKGALESAKAQVTQALIGIVILFSVYLIIKVVETIFGINILLLDIAPLIIQ